jgi:hypothetical protein
MSAMLTLNVLLVLAVLLLGCWNSAYGRGKTCQNVRVPRCGCDPENRRKPWRNSGR